MNLKTVLSVRNRSRRGEGLFDAGGITGLNGDTDPLSEELGGALVATVILDSKF